MRPDLIHIVIIAEHRIFRDITAVQLFFEGHQMQIGNQPALRFIHFQQTGRLAVFQQTGQIFQDGLQGSGFFGHFFIL
jgi:hypothetical protein